ncbi:MAG: helix-turn-helix domain containing protein [Lachnospiraceae bacterium]|nr:helix-turn-helix domain containing protein [Lachnospiraceae bacterium]
MTKLYDEKEILEDFIASERREEREYFAKATAIRLRIKHLSVEDIAEIIGYNTSTVERWIGLVPQI